MEAENKNDITHSKEEKTTSLNDPKVFWKKHFIELALAFLLIVSVGWGYFGKKNTISKYEEKITNLTEVHESEIKELKAEHIRQLSTTLALAVRSEMIADNLSQVDQYFVQTVKMFNIERILLVNQTDGKVILSTNRKDEDSVFKGEALVKTGEAVKKSFDGHTYAATPIMGLNTQLGVLILQID
ncbi:MAG TPA: hypothetical protein VL021_12685 [Brumimicrobium sp.]|nr:hypothetical protein [Brumimicrobium sp.]